MPLGHRSAAQPGASNREIADAAEVADQGQISKVLARLRNLGLIHDPGLCRYVAGVPSAGELVSDDYEQDPVQHDAPKMPGRVALRGAGGPVVGVCRGWGSKEW
jgi:hypothetical protein